MIGVRLGLEGHYLRVLGIPRMLGRLIRGEAAMFPEKSLEEISSKRSDVKSAKHQGKSPQSLF